MSINLLYQEVYENCSSSLKDDLNRSFFGATTVSQFMNAITDKRDWITIAKVCDLAKPLVTEFFIDALKSKKSEPVVDPEYALLVRCLAATKSEKAKQILISCIPEDPDHDIFVATLLWLYHSFEGDKDVVALFETIEEKEDLDPNLRIFVRRVLSEDRKRK